jgi:predicted ester cyclase
MFNEQNKDLSRRAIALWSTEDITKAEEILASNYINHQHHHPDREQPIIGLENWKHFIVEFRNAFPNLQDTIADQIVEGDKVVTRFTSTESPPICQCGKPCLSLVIATWISSSPRQI